MQAITPEVLLADLRWRYATKHFDPAKIIPPALWSALEEAVQLAPSSYGLSPWKFVIVKDPALRARLREAAWNQPQIVEASHLVVFCRKLEMTSADIDAYVARIAEVRSVAVESLADFRAMMLGSIQTPPPGFDAGAWMSRQVYIALGFFLSAAAMLGIDACPMEGFLPERFDEILGLRAQGYASVVLATAGYRGDDWLARAPKVRWPRPHVIDER